MNLYKTIFNTSINPYFHWRKYHTDGESVKIYLKVFGKFFEDFTIEKKVSSELDT